MFSGVKIQHFMIRVPALATPAILSWNNKQKRQPAEKAGCRKNSMKTE